MKPAYKRYADALVRGVPAEEAAGEAWPELDKSSEQFQSYLDYEQIPDVAEYVKANKKNEPVKKPAPKRKAPAKKAAE